MACTGRLVESCLTADLRARKNRAESRRYLGSRIQHVVRVEEFLYRDHERDLLLGKARLERVCSDLSYAVFARDYSFSVDGDSVYFVP